MVPELPYFLSFPGTNYPIFPSHEWPLAGFWRIGVNPHPFGTKSFVLQFASQISSVCCSGPRVEINGAHSIKNVFTKQHVKATRKPIKQSLANFASIQVCNKVFASLVTALSNEGLLASKQGQKFSVARLHLFLHSIFFTRGWHNMTEHDTTYKLFFIDPVQYHNYSWHFWM